MGYPLSVKNVPKGSRNQVHAQPHGKAIQGSPAALPWRNLSNS